MFGRNIVPGLLPNITNGEVGENDTESLVTCCDDINLRQDENLYFIIGHLNSAVELFGCPSRNGLMALSIYFRIFLLTYPSILFRGTIQNPKELPYNMGDDVVSLVIFADHSLKMFYTMAKTTDYIETHLARYTASSIDDFAIITGAEHYFDIEEWRATVKEGVTANGIRY